MSTFTATSVRENLKSVEHTAEAWNTGLAAHRRMYLLVASVLSLLTFSGYSHPKVPWFDEVVLLTIARLQSVGQIWAALMSGIQNDPPTLQVLVHYLFRIFGEHIFLARLPAILGFTLMCLSLALLLWRYVPPLYAAAGFFLPYATVLRGRAMDARPYGLMLGFSALSLLCWDAFGDPKVRHRTAWRIAYTCSLAVTFSTHFYSILLLAPLAAGELCRWVLRKKADWWMPVTTAVALIPYVIWLPILRSGMRVLKLSSGHFRPLSFETFYEFYSFLIAGMPMAALLFFLAAAILLAGRMRGAAAPWTVLSQRYRELTAACLAFLLLPAVGYAAGLLVTGFFINYYHMVAAFGVILGIPLALSAITDGNRVVGLCLFVAMASQGLFVTVRGLSGFVRHAQEYPTLAQMRALIPETQPDIVVSAASHFLPYHDAVRGQSPDNLLFLFDQEKALQELGTDVHDIFYEKLRPFTDARIEPFASYTATHPRFYLAVVTGPEVIGDWLFPYLLKHHADFHFLGHEGDFDLFQVDLRPETGAVTR